MPHVVLVTTSYPDGSPGSEAAGSFVADFAAELARLARVTVLAASRADSTQRDGGLTVRRFEVPRLPLSLLRPANPAHWPAIARSLRAGGRALDELVARDRPDHVLALWALPSGYWAMRSAQRHGVPYSVWALGSDIWSLARIPVVRGVLRRVLARADARYADGLALAADVEAVGGRRCRFLASSRRLPPAAAGSRAPGPPYRLAFLGRWHVNKGTDLLLEALGELRDEDWQRIRELRLCGGGPLADVVQAGVARLAEAGRPVTLGGYLDRQAAADLLGWADFLLVPSRIESIPVIFSDALQLGTPLVATPVGDLPALFGEEPVGILAADVSARAYADALRRALDASPADFEQGLARMRERFDPARSAASFVDGCRLAVP